MLYRSVIYKALVLLIVLMVLASCYPLATGSMKWRITPDRKKKQYNKSFFAETGQKHSGAPNVIIIMADDLGKYEVSAYGGQHVKTPNIDQLLAEGLRFQNAYSSSPVCAPSRAGIMTGRYQQRYGFETQEMQFYPTNFIEYLSGKYLANTGDFVVKSKPVYPREWQIVKQGVPPTEVLLSELFKSYGYSTAWLGKWHLGHSKKHVPENRGFDYTYGFLGHSSLYTPEQGTPGYVAHIQDQFSAHHQWNTKRNGFATIRENGKSVVEEDYLTWAIKDKGIDWMTQHKDEPFFLYLSFNAPHVPFQAPLEYYCKWEVDAEGNPLDENHRVYYAMINAFDDAVGEVNQAVKDLGIEENTIIWFVSDNGGASYTGATENGPLKGGKMTHFEGGVNVPMGVKWPGVLPAGSVYEPSVSTLDIFVTSACQAQMTLPDDRVYDGVNLLPFLTSQVTDDPHSEIFFRADHIEGMIQGNYKFVHSTRDNWIELYNLDLDKSEMQNLYDSVPDIYQEMYELHQLWQDELPKKPMWPRIMDKRFILEDGKEYLFPA